MNCTTKRAKHTPPILYHYYAHWHCQANSGIYASGGTALRTHLIVFCFDGVELIKIRHSLSMGACLSCGSHREVAPAPEVPHRAGHSVFGKETEDVHAV